MSQLTKFNLTTVAKSLGDDPVTVRRAKLMAAVDELSPNETVRQQLTEYMTMASTAMINSPSQTI